MPVYPTGPCYFCSTDGRWRLLVALCAEHRALLTSGGGAGRVHGPSGVRWWFEPHGQS